MNRALHTYVCIYIYIYMYLSLYLYIYIYIHRERERERERYRPPWIRSVVVFHATGGPSPPQSLLRAHFKHRTESYYSTFLNSLKHVVTAVVVIVCRLHEV